MKNDEAKASAARGASSGPGSAWRWSQRLLSAAFVALWVAACGGGDPPKGACVRGSGPGASCGDDFTDAQCNLVNGDRFYEGRTCRDLGFR